MAGTKQILDRRNAAENISKVTHMMETVSAVRYRHYYRQWADSLGFYNALAQLAYLIVTAERTVEHPLMLGNDSRCNAIVVIGSNRGLCGAYNSNIAKLVDVHINMARRFGRELKIYAKGNKIINHLNNRDIELAGTYTDFEEVPSAERAREIAEDFVKQYKQGQIGRLGVIYTRFFSVAGQQAQTLTVLPVAELIDDLTTRATVIWPWELAFEDFILSPSAEEIFDAISMLMVRTSIAGCFLDASISEHLARVVSMRSATDNADEMIEQLKKDYNRARQAQITTELLDIVGGAIMS
jgi:F-type H+-transporting ATPase subunit gamma